MFVQYEKDCLKTTDRFPIPWFVKKDSPFRLNFSLSRGLDIYTGNIWEAYDLNEVITSSLGAGGRYDKVIGEYSNSKDDIPAVGISFGLVPIMSALNIESKKEC